MLAFSPADYRKNYLEILEKSQNAKKSKLNTPHLDFGLELVFFPLESGEILVMVISSQKSYFEYIKQMDNVQYYGYWNNSDSEDGVSEEDWEQRKKDWDEALPGIGIPAQSGFYTTIIPEYEIPWVDTYSKWYEEYVLVEIENGGHKSERTDN